MKGINAGGSSSLEPRGLDLVDYLTLFMPPPKLEIGPIVPTPFDYCDSRYAPWRDAARMHFVRADGELNHGMMLLRYDSESKAQEVYDVCLRGQCIDGSGRKKLRGALRRDWRFAPLLPHEKELTLQAVQVHATDVLCVGVGGLLDEDVAAAESWLAQTADLARRLLTHTQDCNALVQAHRDREAAASLARRAAVKTKLLPLIGAHLPIVEHKIRRSIVTDDYGRVDPRAAIREFDYFLDRVVRPQVTLPSDEQVVLVDAVWDLINETESASTLQADATTWTSGRNFEEYCADVLRQAGWSARLTAASGDQGADIVARYRSISLVVQCKLWQSAVGNAAVQEAIAGTIFERADFGMVVTTSTFTRSARELASASGVFLVHHSQLPERARILAVRAVGPES